MNIRVKINKIKNRKVEKINKTKRQFFKKVNKLINF